MKKIVSCLSLLFCLGGITLQAQPVEKIILKNGTVLEGYISKQRPGKDMVFTAEKAVVYIPSEAVKSITNRSMEWKSLSPAWQQWALENNAVEGQGKQRTVTLSDILRIEVQQSVSDSVQLSEPRSVNNVRVLEEGMIVKYLDLGSSVYTLTWDTVQVIKRDKREATDLSGLNDVVVLKSTDRELEGQIIEQVPGKLLRLLKTNGIVEVIDQKQIAKQKKVKLNPDQDLFAQSPLLDVVQPKKGRAVSGIIIEQNFGDANDPSYLLIQTQAGNVERIEHSNVLETRREENTEYTPLCDVLLKKGEMLVNRQKVKEAIVDEHDDLITIAPQSDSLVFKLDSLSGKLIVEANFTNDNEADDLVLLKIGPKPVNKKEFCNGFTYKEIVTNSIRYETKETSINNTTKLVYPVTKRGSYVFYTPKKKQTVLCVIK